jgi:hypothetical protein
MSRRLYNTSKYVGWKQADGKVVTDGEAEGI